MTDVPLEAPSPTVAGTPGGVLRDVGSPAGRLAEPPAATCGAELPHSPAGGAGAAPAPVTYRTRPWLERQLRSLRRLAAYLAVRLAHAVVCRLPFRLGRQLGWLAGGCAYHLGRRPRQIALSNLRASFPELPETAVRALALASFRTAASAVIDWAILRRWPTQKLRARFPELAREVESTARIWREAGGLVGFTAHFGNWEVLSMIFSRLAPGLIVPVANRHRSTRLHDFVHRLRRETGLEVLLSEQSARKMILAVREGKVLGLLPDHEVRTNGAVFVSFLGRPAYTATFPVALARRLRAPSCFILLRKTAGGFQLVTRPVFEFQWSEDESADLLGGTQQWSRLLEEEIRKDPGQWTWMQDRWQHQPGRPRHHVGRGPSSKP